MSAFYDLASLVVVPSGYKSGKVYAQKPLTTDGQLAFTRASTATRVNASGLVEAVASGVPRLDYLNSTCPKLLLEPQRTNLVLYSEQFDNVAWVKQNLTITANAIASPSGATDADKLVETAATGAHRALCPAATLNGTFSFYAKAGERTKVAILSTVIDLGFDLSNGTLINLGSGTSGGKIENAGNGWYRCSLYQASGIVALSLGLLNNSGTISYAGDGTSGAYFWGAQLEAEAYATSYIPTLGASVTRVADAASKTGITSLIGQTEGTIFIDFIQKAVGASVVQIQLNDGSNSNRVQLEVNSSGNGVMYVFSGGGLTGQINLGAFATGTEYKVAMAYKANDFVTYINGVSAGTDTSGAVPVSMSRIDLGAEVGSSFTGFELNQALLFKTRLTNAQLAELTA